MVPYWGLKFKLKCHHVRKSQTKEIKCKEQAFPSRSWKVTAMGQQSLKRHDIRENRAHAEFSPRATWARETSLHPRKQPKRKL